jgi:osmotically-inducible protein OsmY
MTCAKTCDAVPLASLVLAKSSIRELRQIRVDESDQAVELSGSVRSYYHKQLAQETVRNVAKGRQLINRVEVSR